MPTGSAGATSPDGLPPLVHVTTVHPRRDTRIYHKETQTLRALGRRVILVVADGLGDEDAGPDSVRIIDVGVPGNRLSRAVVGNVRALRTVLKLKPAVVHFHDPELIALGLVLKPLGYKVVYDVHEDVPQQIYNKHWIAPPLRWAVSRAISAVERVAKWSFDAFVPATKHIGSHFPEARTVVVQNFPILEELFAPSATRYADRPPHVAYVGVVTEERGGRQMVDALEMVGASNPDVRLEWAGKFFPAAFEARLRALAGWKQVKYHGQLDRGQVADMLGACRAGLVVFQPAPNHLEAQPNKLFEYMAAGLPVIASDFPLWRRLVSDIDCGLLVDPGKPEEIARAIAWILDHTDEAEAMGRRGQAAVAGVYSWEGEGKKLKDLYAALLGPSGLPSSANGT